MALKVNKSSKTRTNCSVLP